MIPTLPWAANYLPKTSEKSCDCLSANSCPVFWLTKHPRRALLPRHSRSLLHVFRLKRRVESGMYHKSQSELAAAKNCWRICWLRFGACWDGTEQSAKTFFPSFLGRRMSEIFSAHSTFEQLVIFLSTPAASINVQHIFCRWLILSPQNFPHTARNVAVRSVPGRPGGLNCFLIHENEIIMHNFNSRLSLSPSSPFAISTSDVEFNSTPQTRPTEDDSQKKGEERAKWDEARWTWGRQSAFNFPYEKSLLDGSRLGALRAMFNFPFAVIRLSTNGSELTAWGRYRRRRRTHSAPKAHDKSRNCHKRYFCRAVEVLKRR